MKFFHATRGDDDDVGTDCGGKEGWWQAGRQAEIPAERPLLRSVAQDISDSEGLLSGVTTRASRLPIFTRRTQSGGRKRSPGVGLGCYPEHYCVWDARFDINKM
jgi:hypothetical protein